MSYLTCMDGFAGGKCVRARVCPLPKHTHTHTHTQSWLKAHKEPYFTAEVKAWLGECFDKYVAETLNFYKKKMDPVLAQPETTLVENLLRFLDAILNGKCSV